MDDKQRIALVETRTLDTAGNDRAPRQLIRYQFGNHLGSASLELDEQAQIISYEEYAPYGSSTYQAVRSQTETAKRYRYTGRERDEESGFYYHGARYYAPWLGRWVSCDPIGVRQESNLFNYCSGNPLNRTDSQGTEWEFTWKFWQWEPVRFTKEEIAPGGRVFSGNFIGFFHAILGYETDRDLGPDQRAGYEWAQSTFRWQKFKPVQKVRDDIINDPYASKVMAGVLGLISAVVPGAPDGDDLPESMQRTYKMMKYASTNATMIVGAIESFRPNQFTPPGPPAVTTSSAPVVATTPSALAVPAPAPLAMAMVASGNGSAKGESKSGTPPKPAGKKLTLKDDAGKIHGVDQYRGGQVILTAELEVPDGKEIKRIKVAVPNEGGKWRDLQREEAIRLGYQPLEASTPGSEMHAEGELEAFRRDNNATVLEWAISRGKGGNSIVCNEGCKNFTKNWGPQQK